MILGDYTFEWLPDSMTIPEVKKTVAVVPTYSGSAIFQWDPLIQGEQVTLKWNFCSIEQYDALRAEYFKTASVLWVTDQMSGETPLNYNVMVINLVGTYFDVHLDDLPYRKDVTLTLDIRSATWGAV